MTTEPCTFGSEFKGSGSTFETSDFYLGCFLRSQGFELADLRREGNRSFFVFRDRPDRRTLILRFYSNEGQVPPLTFVGAIRDLRSLLHNG